MANEYDPWAQFDFGFGDTQTQPEPFDAPQAADPWSQFDFSSASDFGISPVSAHAPYSPPAPVTEKPWYQRMDEWISNAPSNIYQATKENPFARAAFGAATIGPQLPGLAVDVWNQFAATPFEERPTPYAQETISREQQLQNLGTPPNMLPQAPKVPSLPGDLMQPGEQPIGTSNTPTPYAYEKLGITKEQLAKAQPPVEQALANLQPENILSDPFDALLIPSQMMTGAITGDPNQVIENVAGKYSFGQQANVLAGQPANAPTPSVLTDPAGFFGKTATTLGVMAADPMNLAFGGILKGAGTVAEGAARPVLSTLEHLAGGERLLAPAVAAADVEGGITRAFFGMGDAGTEAVIKKIVTEGGNPVVAAVSKAPASAIIPAFDMTATGTVRYLSDVGDSFAHDARNAFQSIADVTYGKAPFIKRIAQQVDKFAFMTPNEKLIQNIFDAEQRRQGFTIPQIYEDMGKLDKIAEGAAKRTGVPADTFKKYVMNAEVKYKPIEPVWEEVTAPKTATSTTGETYNLADQPPEVVGYRQAGDMLSDPVPLKPVDMPVIRFDDAPFVEPPQTESVFGITTKEVAPDAAAKPSATLPLFNQERGGAYHFLGEAKGESNFKSVSENIGGRNRHTYEVTANRPLVIYNNTRANAGESAVIKLAGYDPVQEPGRAFEDLRNLIGEDAFAKVIDTGKKLYPTSTYERLSLVYDRLGAELAKRHPYGYDSILRIAAGSEKNGLKGLRGEYVMLDELPQMIEKNTVPADWFWQLPEDGRAQVKLMMDQAQRLKYPLPQDAAEEALKLMKIRNAKFAEMDVTGLYPASLQSDYLNYFPHMRTAETTAQMEKQMPELFVKTRFGGRALDMQQVAAKVRQWDFPINKVNELGRAKKLPGFEGIYFEKFFEDDPYKLEMMRQLNDARVTSQFNALYDAGMQVSKTKAEAQALGLLEPGPNQWIELPLMKRKVPGLEKIQELFKDKVFDRKDAMLLDNLVSFGREVDRPNAFARYNKAIRDVWAHSTLNFSPTTIARNTYGNILNNWYGEIGVHDYADAADLMAYAKRAAKRGWAQMQPIKLGNRVWQPEELLAAFKDQGVYGGWTTSERVVSAGRKTAAGRFAEVAPGLGKFNRMSEDLSRMAHVIGRMRRGDNLLDAAASMRGHLFDYVAGSFNTTAGRFMRAHTTPFIQWSRYNLPLQIKAMLGMTRSAAPLFRATQVINLFTGGSAISPMDKRLTKLAPDYIQQVGGVPVSKNALGVTTFWLFGNAIPAGDLMALTSKHNAWAKLVSMTHPFWKEFGEQALNKDTFTDRAIVEEGTSRLTKFAGVTMDKRVAHLLRNVRMLGMIDQTLRGYYDDPSKYSPTQRSLLQKIGTQIFAVSTTNVDYEKEWQHYQARLQTLEKNYKRALRDGNTADANDLQDQIDTLRQEFEY